MTTALDVIRSFHTELSDHVHAVCQYRTSLHDLVLFVEPDLYAQLTISNPALWANADGYDLHKWQTAVGELLLTPVPHRLKGVVSDKPWYLGEIRRAAANGLLSALATELRLYMGAFKWSGDTLHVYANAHGVEDLRGRVIKFSENVVGEARSKQVQLIVEPANVGPAQFICAYRLNTAPYAGLRREGEW